MPTFGCLRGKGDSTWVSWCVAQRGKEERKLKRLDTDRGGSLAPEICVCVCEFPVMITGAPYNYGSVVEL